VDWLLATTHDRMSCSSRRRGLNSISEGRKRNSVSAFWKISLTGKFALQSLGLNTAVFQNLFGFPRAYWFCFLNAMAWRGKERK